MARLVASGRVMQVEMETKRKQALGADFRLEAVGLEGAGDAQCRCATLQGINRGRAGMAGGLRDRAPSFRTLEVANAQDGFRGMGAVGALD